MANDEPTIPPDLFIKFKGASKKTREEIGKILISNYTELVNKMVQEADYGSTTAYWKDYTPMTGTIIKGRDFIKKYK